MQKAYLFTASWWPVISRGFIWFMIAIVTSFLAQTNDLTPVKMAAMGMLDWFRISAEVLLSGLITVRTFMDQTLARHKGTIEKGKI